MSKIYFILLSFTVLFFTACNNCKKGAGCEAFHEGHETGQHDKENGSKSDSYTAWTYYKLGHGDAEQYSAPGNCRGCYEDGYKDGYNGKKESPTPCY